MSLRAGGVGLNLTAASNVFLMVCIFSVATSEIFLQGIFEKTKKKKEL